MTSTKPTVCIWRGRTSPRTLRGRHLEGCEAIACPGCQPCPERHCRICGKAHVTVDGRGHDQTCAECLCETRNDLGLMLTLSERLMGEAEVRGIDSEAAALAGPAINTPAGIEAFGYRRMSAIMGRIKLDEDDKHPLWVAGSWETVVRDHLGQQADENARIRIWSAIDYLGEHLTRLAHDEEFPFEDLATEICRCRGHLEDVLHDGEQVEQGAPCLKCKTPLTRTTDDNGVTTYECERCHDKLSENRYKLAVRQAHIENADRLNVDDLAERIGVPTSTIRRWASVKRIQVVGEEVVILAALIRDCGRDANGRKVYRVSDALGIRDTGGDHRTSGSVSNEGAA